MTAWPYMMAMTAAGLAGGALAVPAARRLLLGDIERDWLRNELDLDRIDPDGATVHTKSGAAFRAFSLAGQPYDTKPQAQQDALLSGREDWLNGLGDKGLSVRLFGVKRTRDAGDPAEWPTPALREIGAAEAQAFRASFSVRWFAVLATNAGNPRPLSEATGRTLAALADYRPRLLERAPDGAACALAGFLNLLICGDLRDDLPAVSANVSATLPASDLRFERHGAIVAYQPAETHYRVIAMRAWPDTVSGALTGALLALPGEIELAQIAIPIGREAALAQLARKRNEHRFNFFGGGVAAEEHDAAIELLSDGKHTLFTTQFQIVLRARSEAALDTLTDQVMALLAARRSAGSVETAAAATAWFNRHPAADRLIRPLRLMNRDVAALWPFHHAPTGRRSSPWGNAPVRLLRTGEGQAYSFQFHIDDTPQAKGHYLVFAPTGAGKTTLMMHLLGGLARFAGVRSYIFDSREGARFMVEALGGEYQSFDTLRLNPLDVGADTPAARQRLARIIKAMLGNLAATEEAETAVKQMIDTAFDLAPPNRTFDTIFPAAFANRSQTQRAFAKWVRDDAGNTGHYAHVFNAPRDGLSTVFGGAFMAGINMNEILNDPVLGPPAVAHISAAVSQNLAGSGGFNIFIDEAAALLRNPGFRDTVAEMFREYRKLDGVVGLAFQDPAALLDSGIAEAVIDNVSTLIFFPNALAGEKSYAPFHLNDEQLDFILRGGAAGGGRRVLLVKRDAATGFDESVVLDIDLAPFGDIARFYRSGAAAVRDLERLKRNHGKDWQHHV